ncbi:hypothetical protein MTO96_029118, partial [Rhipicephalus appendiculatus]
MDSEGQALYKKNLSEDDTAEGQKRRCVTVLLTSLLVVCLGLLCSLLLLAYLASRRSTEDSATIDALAPLDVPKSSTTRVTWSSEDDRWHARNTSESTPNGKAHVAPTPRSNSGDCTGPACRIVGFRLRELFSYDVSPCDDFYKHICGKFRGYSTFISVQTDVNISLKTYLLHSEIPTSNQLSWQKAAAMYHACLSFTSSYKPETNYLVEWMVSLNLDLLNETRLANVDPVEMMVRGAVHLGVEAIISILFDERKIEAGKRVMKMDRSKQLDTWRSKYRYVGEYVRFLTVYGAKPPFDKQLAMKIQLYENL